jgi:hypothetical protein
VKANQGSNLSERPLFKCSQNASQGFAKVKVTRQWPHQGERKSAGSGEPHEGPGENPLQPVSLEDAPELALAETEIHLVTDEIFLCCGYTSI